MYNQRPKLFFDVPKYMELQGSKDIDAKRKLHHNIARPCGLFRVQLCLHGVAEGLWNGH